MTAFTNSGDEGTEAVDSATTHWWPASKRTLVHPGPGEDCDRCGRRVPHPRKSSSPRATHPVTFGRAPSDITDELKERVNALSQDAGLTSLPYHQARTVMLLLTIAESVDGETLKAVAGGMSWGTGKDADD